MVDRQQCDLSAQYVSLSADKSSGKSADVSHCVHGMLYAAYITHTDVAREKRVSFLYLFLSAWGGDNSPRRPLLNTHRERKYSHC